MEGGREGGREGRGLGLRRLFIDIQENLQITLWICFRVPQFKAWNNTHGKATFLGCCLSPSSPSFTADVDVHPIAEGKCRSCKRAAGL